LDEISHLVTVQDPAGGSDQSIASGENRRNKIQRLAVFLLLGGVATIVIGIYWAMITQIIIAKGEVMGGVLFLAVFSVLLIAAMLLGYSNMTDKKKANRQTSKTQALANAKSAGERLLESPPLAMQSVTEYTTELLEDDKQSDSEPGRSVKPSAERM
jgi:hypothetical protein